MSDELVHRSGTHGMIIALKKPESGEGPYEYACEGCRRGEHQQTLCGLPTAEVWKTVNTELVTCLACKRLQKENDSWKRRPLARLRPATE